MFLKLQSRLLAVVVAHWEDLQSWRWEAAVQWMPWAREQQGAILRACMMPFLPSAVLSQNLPLRAFDNMWQGLAELELIKSAATISPVYNDISFLLGLLV